jgi:hypothetical protein
VLIYELCAVVDLVVDDHEQVLLGVVLGNILVGELLVGHFGWFMRWCLLGEEKARAVLSTGRA